MPNYTPNLGLVIPMGAEEFDFADWNGNMVKIDAAVGAIPVIPANYYGTIALKAVDSLGKPIAGVKFNGLTGAVEANTLTNNKGELKYYALNGTVMSVTTPETVGFIPTTTNITPIAGQTISVTITLTSATVGTVYIIPTSQVLTIPTHIRKIDIWACGGGGNGGSTSAGKGGAGGGGGGRCKNLYGVGNLPFSLPITIGASGGGTTVVGDILTCSGGNNGAVTRGGNGSNGGGGGNTTSVQMGFQGGDYSRTPGGNAGTTLDLITDMRPFNSPSYSYYCAGGGGGAGNAASGVGRSSGGVGAGSGGGSYGNYPTDATAYGCGGGGMGDNSGGSPGKGYQGAVFIRIAEVG